MTKQSNGMNEKLKHCKLCEQPIPQNKKIPDRVVHTRCVEELNQIFRDADLGQNSDMMAKIFGLFELLGDELENTSAVKNYRTREVAAITKAEARFPGWKKMREEAKAKTIEEQQKMLCEER